MQILVVGCGTIGSTIASLLCEEGHNVTVLDINRSRVEMLTEKIDINGYCGDGTSYDDLIEAGILDTDLMIATTNKDERNFLCCMISRKASNCQTIARVNDATSTTIADFLKEEMGLSMSINPKKAAANAVMRLLKYPAALNVESFGAGMLELSSYKLKKDNPLIGHPLYTLPSRLNCSLLVCMVERGDQVIIPDGNFILQENDVVSLVGDNENIIKYLKKAGLSGGNTKRVMIVGGSTTAEYVLEMLLELNIEVTLIEADLNRCDELSCKYPKANIVHDDGTDQNVLSEEGVSTCDAFISLTDIDEENILLSLYVQSCCDAKVITRTHHVSYYDLLDRFEVGSLIIPQKITGNAIMRYVRAMTENSHIESLYQLAQGRAEALEFIVAEGCCLINKEIKTLSLKKDLIIAGIVREREVIIPGGDDYLMAGDRVVIITSHTGIGDIKDILA